METDYLVVGAGAVGLSFADELVARTDARITLVDRRARPGGHWNDAYAFVRLHLPSAYYGVPSLPLGTDRIEAHGPDAGLYEMATGSEVREYFHRVLDEVLLPTGRVEWLPMSDYSLGPDGAHRVTSRVTGETRTVDVRRRLVDATYLETAIPSRHTPAYVVDPGVRHVSVNGLADVPQAPSRYVVLGAGKTSIDACLWLLDHGVDPSRIRWVRPRDGWFYDRAGWQPLDLVSSTVSSLAQELTAVAEATSVPDLFARLEAAGRLLRIDQSVSPTMFRCATVSVGELARLRRITDVVRLGRVQRITPDELVLDGGSVPGGRDHLYVDCTAAGIASRPARPIFEPDRITLQQVRHCTPVFNAALVAYVEATRDDPTEQNRLCPPNPLPTVPEDWLRMLATTMRAAGRWLAAPDLLQWVESCRLNISSGLAERLHDPGVQAAAGRYAASVRPALDRLPTLLAELTPA